MNVGDQAWWGAVQLPRHPWPPPASKAFLLWLLVQPLLLLQALKPDPLLLSLCPHQAHHVLDFLPALARSVLRGEKKGQLWVCTNTQCFIAFLVPAALTDS